MQGASLTLLLDGVDPATEGLAEALTPARADLAAIDGVASVIDPLVLPEGVANPAAPPLVATGGDGFLVVVELAPDLGEDAEERALLAVEDRLEGVPAELADVPGAAGVTGVVGGDVPHRRGDHRPGRGGPGHRGGDRAADRTPRHGARVRRAARRLDADGRRDRVDRGRARQPARLLLPPGHGLVGRQRRDAARARACRSTTACSSCPASARSCTPWSPRAGRRAAADAGTATLPSRTAVARTMATAGRTVAFSALTVAISIAGPAAVPAGHPARVRRGRGRRDRHRRRDRAHPGPGDARARSAAASCGPAWSAASRGCGRCCAHTADVQSEEGSFSRLAGARAAPAVGGPRRRARPARGAVAAARAPPAAQLDHRAAPRGHRRSATTSRRSAPTTRPRRRPTVVVVAETTLDRGDRVGDRARRGSTASSPSTRPPSWARASCSVSGRGPTTPAARRSRTSSAPSATSTRASHLGHRAGRGADRLRRRAHRPRAVGGRDRRRWRPSSCCSS